MSVFKCIAIYMKKTLLIRWCHNRKEKKSTITSTNDWWFHQWLSLVTWNIVDFFVVVDCFFFIVCVFFFCSLLKFSIFPCHSTLRNNWFTYKHKHINVINAKIYLRTKNLTPFPILSFSIFHKWHFILPVHKKQRKRNFIWAHACKQDF